MAYRKFLLALSLCVALLTTAGRRAQGATALTTPTPTTLHGTVLVFPLLVVGDTANSAWIGQAMQQSVLDELARNRGVKVISVKTPPADPSDAIAQAHGRNADYFISGSCQRVDDSLRVIAAVNDINGNSVRPLAARGNLRDLFSMEDAIDSQLASLKPRGAAAPAIGSGYPDQGNPLRMGAAPTYGDGTELTQEIADGPANATDPRTAAAYLRYADQYPCFWGYGCGYGCGGWGCGGWGGGCWGGGYTGFNGAWTSPVGGNLFAAPLPP